MKDTDFPFPVGGKLVRGWTRSVIRCAIDVANPEIRAALRMGKTDETLTLISRKVGLRVCAGDIKVKLRRNRL